MATSLPAVAWRGVWRNRRRTLLTLSSIAFGTMLAILFTAMGDRNWRDMIDLAARLGAGHVALQHPEYLDMPTLGRTVTGTAALRADAERDPEVRRSVERIVGNLMLSSAAQSYGAAFIAFDPGLEDSSTLSLLDALEDGTGFTTADARGIVLGGRLAENLRVGIGRKVIFTLTDKNGEIVQEAVRVVGLVHTGAPTVDAGLALLPIDMLRESLRYEADEASQVALFLEDQRRADHVAARLAPGLDDRVHAVPWHALQPDLASFIAMKVAGDQVMEVIILILVAAGIFNTLFVSVMERRREFGVLLAIGWSPVRIFGLVMLESMWLGLVGLALSAVVTVGPYLYLAGTGIDVSQMMGSGSTEVAGIAMSSTLHVGIYPESALLIATAALIATLLSGLYPAWSAGRIAPVETIRLA